MIKTRRENVFWVKMEEWEVGILGDESFLYGCDCGYQNHDESKKMPMGSDDK